MKCKIINISIKRLFFLGGINTYKDKHSVPLGVL